VKNDSLPYFRDAAKLLIDKYNGNYENAICATLAYISGHYKNVLNSRSLVTGQERQVTLCLKSTRQRWNNPVSTAQTIIKKYWPSALADSVQRGIRAFRNG